MKFLLALFLFVAAAAAAAVNVDPLRPLPDLSCCRSHYPGEPSSVAGYIGFRSF